MTSWDRFARQGPTRDRHGGWWSAWEPGQWTWVGRRQCCEARVEDGRRIDCGSKVASGGDCQQVMEWMLPRFGRQGE